MDGVPLSFILLFGAFFGELRLLQPWDRLGKPEAAQVGEAELFLMGGEG